MIYNISLADARRTVAQALDLLRLEVVEDKEGFRLTARNVQVRISGFPLLRNVSIRLEGGDRELASDFHAALADRLGRVSVEPTAMAVSFLLVATAMLVAPLVLMAERMPEIVRILTDLLP